MTEQEYYKRHLEKVILLWGNGRTPLERERGEEYIRVAKEQYEQSKRK